MGDSNFRRQIEMRFASLRSVASDDEACIPKLAVIVIEFLTAEVELRVVNPFDRLQDD